MANMSIISTWLGRAQVIAPYSGCQWQIQTFEDEGANRKLSDNIVLCCY